MRRIYAFIIMVFTLVAIVFTTAPSINQDKNLGMDFKGGFEILYEINPLEGSELAAKDLTKAASEGILKRLENANIINPLVEKEGEKFIRVSVATASLVEANRIKKIIEEKSEISFRDYQNNLLATSEQILKEKAAEVIPSGQAGIYSINLNISNTNLLKQITGQVSQMEDKHLVIWFGFVEGDDYANKTDPTVGNKIIYDATVESELDDPIITVSSQSFNKERADLTSAVINSGTFDFETDYKQIRQISAQRGETTLKFTLISAVVALALVFIALSIFYKKAGLISSLSIGFTAFLSLLLFNFTKGTYSISSVAGLIVGIALAIDGVVVILERVKKEVYSGKKLAKAYDDGYKKAFSSVLDANITTLIVAVVLFFVGNSTLKAFSGMLLVSVVSVMIGVLVINHTLLSVFSKSTLALKDSSFGGFKQVEIKTNQVDTKVINKSAIEISKKYLKGVGGLAALGLVVALIFGFATNRNFFNLAPEFKEGSEMVIETKINYFNEKQIVIDFLEEIEIQVNEEQITFASVLDDSEQVVGYIVEINAFNNILNKQIQIDDKLIELFGENSAIETNYTLYLRATSSEATFMVVANAAFATLIASIVVGIYLTLRYRYTYGLAALATVAINVVSLVAFFALFRLQIGITFIPAILALVCFSVNSMVSIFTRLKEFLITKKQVYISNEERYKAINNALSASRSRFVVSSAIIVLFLLVTMVIASTSTLMFNIALLIGITFASVSSMLIAPLIWLGLEKRKDRKQRTFKPKKENPLFKEKEERTFIGIND